MYFDFRQEETDAYESSDHVEHVHVVSNESALPGYYCEVFLSLEVWSCEGKLEITKSRSVEQRASSH